MTNVTKVCLAIAVAFMLMVSVPLPVSSEPIQPFATDACSMFPDGTWGECCVEHDHTYWRGGSYWARKRADADLAECVGGPLGLVMYIGVRFGGMSIWPTPFRWGFGYPWPSSGGSDEQETE